MTDILRLILAVFLLVSAGRMLLRSRSLVGTGRLDATDPRTVRIFGWVILVLGISLLGVTVTSLVEGK